jgi:hypothetical protein
MDYMMAIMKNPGKPWQPCLPRRRRRGAINPSDKGQEASMFFFEKKNQKTFSPWRRGLPTNTRPKGKNLFASFSSEKEESFL